MPPSPARPTRSKRESMTITRTMGKALADVMNKDNASDKSSKAKSSNGSDTGTRNTVCSKPPPSAMKDAHRVSRTSMDSQGRSSDSRSTPKLVKRSPAAPSPAKPTIRSRSSMGPPLLPVSKDNTASSKTAFKSRTSLTLRGLSSALQSKTTQQPSSLPKYKPKGTADQSSSGIGTRKRQNDSDVEIVNEPDMSNDVAGASDDSDANDDDDDTDYEIKRPISPLPRRATRTRLIPVVAVSLTPSTPPKNGVLQKVSDRLSSNAPRTKTPNVSASPLSRLRKGATHSRPSSVASNSSQRATPAQSTRKVASLSKPKTTVSAQPSCRRRPVVTEAPALTNTNLTSSPSNPFHLPDASGSSLLSPPLSPSLDDISLDSIDAGDVSALLQTVMSPTNPMPTLSRPVVDISNSSHNTSNNQRPFPPQTPISQQRSLSILTTDPRQSVLSLREYLESSGDIDHLLSQPLPSLFNPEARERLLSFGFSPESAAPPFSTIGGRTEPQTPCPVPDGHGFTSISQVLFPSFGDVSHQTRDQEKCTDPAEEITLGKAQFTSAEEEQLERDRRIEDLEKQLTLSRESHKRETTELSTQLTNLERRLHEVLMERDLETAARVEEFETRLQTQDAEWTQQITLTVAQVQELGAITQRRMLSIERRKHGIGNASAAWDHAREVASSELALLQSSKQFVAITLAGLEMSMEHLRIGLNH
ncbi:hypothetical protein BU17DRAFT_61340 [Hysterangium stoloniferum]|nr:hypothetical protein BU17DRAFT_61340 [Hysterangium stoloniferum]